MTEKSKNKTPNIYLIMRIDIVDTMTKLLYALLKHIKQSIFSCHILY